MLHNNNIFQYYKPHEIPNTSITVPPNSNWKQPKFHRSSYKTSHESILPFFIEKENKTKQLHTLPVPLVNKNLKATICKKANEIIENVPVMFSLINIKSYFSNIWIQKIFIVLLQMIFLNVTWILIKVIGFSWK